MAFSSSGMNSQNTADGKSSTELFTFDNGDVTIQVTYHGEAIMGTVFSTAMATASSVWKKFIYPPWAQTPQNPDSVNQVRIPPKPALCAPPIDKLDFREDDGDALLVLLRIAHLQFKHITSRPDAALFHGVLELCDLYDCVELIKPWIGDWMIKNPCYGRRVDPRWLFSSWILGMPDKFEIAARSIVLAIDADGEMVRDGMRFSLKAGNVPPDIVGGIFKARKTVVKAVIGVIQQWVEEFTSDEDTQCFCVYLNRHCDAVILGNIIREVVAIGIWPKRSPSRCTESVDDLVGRFSSLGGYSYHKTCIAGLRRTLPHAYEIPKLTQDSHRRHMEIQAVTIIGQSQAT
ncbi:hypothetical protein EG329_011011 [Mollisiaceae sp. DMI_Dod_QoI]|nr:hypothetical protein EG329_011011 [Helotiales sp. DMI_Dod_QoI]